jgi:hypothetical protein
MIKFEQYLNEMSMSRINLYPWKRDIENLALEIISERKQGSYDISVDNFFKDYMEKTFPQWENKPAPDKIEVQISSEKSQKFSIGIMYTYVLRLNRIIFHVSGVEFNKGIASVIHALTRNFQLMFDFLREGKPERVDKLLSVKDPQSAYKLPIINSINLKGIVNTVRLLPKKILKRIDSLETLLLFLGHEEKSFSGGIAMLRSPNLIKAIQTLLTKDGVSIDRVFSPLPEEQKHKLVEDLVNAYQTSEQLMRSILKQ